MKHLIEFLTDWTARSNRETLDEASTKQGLILPILQCVGWNPFNIDEVTPELAIGGKRVDYALRVKGILKVFLEIKRPSENLNIHQEQLLSYAFQQGVKMAVLTNGQVWWLYLPLHEGSWEQRKFFTIDVLQQTPEEVARHFDAFLSRPRIETGEAYVNADTVYTAR